MTLPRKIPSNNGVTVMNVKNRVRRYFNVGLRLSQAQRKLILEGEISIPVETEHALRATPAHQQIMLTLEEWWELAGQVASQANDAADDELQKKLDKIFLKINDLLEIHADENPSACLKTTQPLAEESVLLAQWVTDMLIGAEKLGIKSNPVVQFPLHGAKRAVVMMTPTIDGKIRKKLAAKDPNLTVSDVGGLLMAVSQALVDAGPLQQFALIMTAKSLMDCLRSEVNGC